MRPPSRLELRQQILAKNESDRCSRSRASLEAMVLAIQSMECSPDSFHDVKSFAVAHAKGWASGRDVAVYKDSLMLKNAPEMSAFDLAERLDHVGKVLWRVWRSAWGPAKEGVEQRRLAMWAKVLHTSSFGFPSGLSKSVMRGLSDQTAITELSKICLKVWSQESRLGFTKYTPSRYTPAERLWMWRIEECRLKTFSWKEFFSSWEAYEERKNEAGCKALFNAAPTAVWFYVLSSGFMWSLNRSDQENRAARAVFSNVNVTLQLTNLWDTATGAPLGKVNRVLLLDNFAQVFRDSGSKQKKISNAWRRLREKNDFPVEVVSWCDRLVFGQLVPEKVGHEGRVQAL